MPVKKDPNSNKWCFGSNCNYKTKKDAEAAEQAYYASKVDKCMEKIVVNSPSEDIMKATADDVRRYLFDALKANYIFEDGWVHSVDYDSTYVYFSVEYYNHGYFDITYRLSYKLVGVTVTFDGDIEEVKKETVYTLLNPDNSPKVVSDDGSDSFEDDGNIFQKLDRSISKSINGAINKLLGNKKELPIIKQFDDEEMIAIEPMYTLPDTEDGHGEQMDADTIRKMVDSANEAISEGRLSGGLFHAENIDAIEPVKAWVNECDCIIGNTEVPEGLPIIKMQFHDEDLWEMRKSGILKGVSIGAQGEREDIDDD